MHRLLVLLCVVSQCAFSQLSYRLLVKLPKRDTSITGLTLYYYQGDQNITVKGKRVGGVFTFQHPLEYSCLANFIVEKKGPPEMLFNMALLEPGVNMDADASNGFQSISFAGSLVQKSFSSYKSIYDGFYQRHVFTRSRFYAAFAASDSALMRYYSDLNGNISDSLRLFHEQFFAKDQFSLVTALMLPNYVTYDWLYLDKALQFYSKLNAKVKSHPDVQKFYTGLLTAKQYTAGQRFPDFNLEGTDGKLERLSGHIKGQYVLIDMWASWCKPCREELPLLKNVFEKYKEKGFSIVGISLDNNRQAWLTAIEKYKMSWLNVIDPKEEFASKLNASVIPRNFLIDPQGKIIATGLRQLQLQDALTQIFSVNR